MKKPLMFIFCILFAFSGITTQANPWQPSPGHTQIPLWPKTVPDAQLTAKPEEIRVISNPLVAGKPWLMVGPIAQPTMTVYSPKGKNTGAAVIVFPGGGYWILAMDLEGTEVCD